MCRKGGCPTLPEQVGPGKVHDLVSPAIQNRLDHIQVEIHDLIQFEAGRHGQFLPVHRNINQRRTVMRECPLQGRPKLFRVVHVQAQSGVAQ